MNIKEMSTVELEAMGYRLIIQNARVQQELQMVNAELDLRAKMPEAPKKK